MSTSFKAPLPVWCPAAMFPIPIKIARQVFSSLPCSRHPAEKVLSLEQRRLSQLGSVDNGKLAVDLLPNRRDEEGRVAADEDLAWASTS